MMGGGGGGGGGGAFLRVKVNFGQISKSHPCFKEEFNIILVDDFKLGTVLTHIDMNSIVILATYFSAYVM